MDILKQKTGRYIQIKDEIKKLGEEKKIIEKGICDIMSSNDISTIELPDGSYLNFQIKESISIGKEKTNKQ